MSTPHSNSKSATAGTDEGQSALLLPEVAVGDRLFRGNRTEILLIEHPSYGLCAQKRLLAFCDVQAERTRMEREATLQRQASHPGVVPVLGHDGASLYRGYVPGPTLAQWVKQQCTVSPSQASSIVSSLCSTITGLHEAPRSTGATPHPRGASGALVHRDITPSNVYVDSQQVLLSDFGLAFAQYEPPRPNEYLQGSPRFLPPELIAGHAPSAAGDVYQVALLLAWLLEEPLRRFVIPSTHGLSVDKQWARAQAWHEPARQVLKAHGWDSALDPDPRGRPTAREFLALIQL